MTTGNGSDSSSLFSRAKEIILHPAEEWNKIAKEETPSRDIFVSYIVPLALIGPLAGFIAGQWFGYFPFGVVPAIAIGVTAYFFAIISVLALVLIADFLSPKFGGEANYYRCFKLVVYASTAAWISGIFTIIPALSVFSLLGLYSIYLFYVGTGPMLNIPKDKALAFTAVVFLCAIALNLAMVSLSAANVQLLSSMGIITPADMPMHMRGMPNGQ